MSGPASSEGIVRLNRFLREAGIDSRRHCDRLIAEGRVHVNGRQVEGMGAKVDPARDVVEVDGHVVVQRKDDVTIMLNKPCGYLSAMSDPSGKPCVSQLVPLDAYPALYHIGRLDNDTSGLLLFSTDGALGHGLLHPSKLVWKTYRAVVEGTVLPGQVQRLAEGVDIDGRSTAPARVRLLQSGPRESTLEICIHEGRNRQVRRMCQAIGHPVTRLERTGFADLVLGGLAVGSWRKLDEGEVAALREYALPSQPQ